MERKQSQLRGRGAGPWSSLAPRPAQLVCEEAPSRLARRSLHLRRSHATLRLLWRCRRRKSRASGGKSPPPPSLALEESLDGGTARLERDSCSVYLHKVLLHDPRRTLLELPQPLRHPPLRSHPDEPQPAHDARRRREPAPRRRVGRTRRRWELGRCALGEAVVQEDGERGELDDRVDVGERQVGDLGTANEERSVSSSTSPRERMRWEATYAKLATPKMRSCTARLIEKANEQAMTTARRPTVRQVCSTSTSYTSACHREGAVERRNRTHHGQVVPRLLDPDRLKVDEPASLDSRQVLDELALLQVGRRDGRRARELDRRRDGLGRAEEDEAVRAELRARGQESASALCRR